MSRNARVHAGAPGMWPMPGAPAGVPGQYDGTWGSRGQAGRTAPAKLRA